MNDSHDEELLSAYLDGELTAEEQARVQRRLAEDSGYRQLHDELRAVRQHLESIPMQKLPADFSQSVLAAAERQMIAPRRSAGESHAASPAERRWVRPLTWTALIAAAAVLVMVFSPTTQQAPNVARHDAPPRAPQADQTASSLGVTGKDAQQPPTGRPAEMRAVQESAASQSTTPADQVEALGVPLGRAEKKLAPSDEEYSFRRKADLSVADTPANAAAPAAPIPAPSAAAPATEEKAFRADPSASVPPLTVPQSKPAEESLSGQTAGSQPANKEQAEKRNNRFGMDGDAGGRQLGDTRISGAGSSTGGPGPGWSPGGKIAENTSGRPAAQAQARSTKGGPPSAYDVQQEAPRDDGLFASRQSGLKVTGSISADSTQELSKWVAELKPQSRVSERSQQGQAEPLAAKAEAPRTAAAEIAPQQPEAGKQAEAPDLVYQLDLTYDAMIDLLARMRSRPDLYQLDPLDPAIEKVVAQRGDALANLKKADRGRGQPDANAGQRQALAESSAPAGPARDAQEDDGKPADLKRQDKATQSRGEKQAAGGSGGGQIAGKNKDGNEAADDKYKALESEGKAAASPVYRLQIVLRRTRDEKAPAAARQKSDR